MRYWGLEFQRVNLGGETIQLITRAQKLFAFGTFNIKGSFFGSELPSKY